MYEPVVLLLILEKVVVVHVQAVSRSLEPKEAEADHHCQNLKSVAVALPEVYLDLLHSKLEAEANQEAPRSATEKRVLMSAAERDR